MVFAAGPVRMCWLLRVACFAWCMYGMLVYARDWLCCIVKCSCSRQVVLFGGAVSVLGCREISGVFILGQGVLCRVGHACVCIIGVGMQGACMGQGAGCRYLVQAVGDVAVLGCWQFSAMLA